jgi:hypothetical protein
MSDKEWEELKERAQKLNEAMSPKLSEEEQKEIDEAIHKLIMVSISEDTLGRINNSDKIIEIYKDIKKYLGEQIKVADVCYGIFNYNFKVLEPIVRKILVPTLGETDDEDMVEEFVGETIIQTLSYDLLSIDIKELDYEETENFLNAHNLSYKE